MIAIKLRPRLRVIGCPKDIEKRLPMPLAAAGMLVQKEAEVYLSVAGPDAKPGEEWPAYYNRDTKKWTEASIPNDPPHRQTGDLLRSLRRIFSSKTQIDIVASPKNRRTGFNYAAVLEFGGGKTRGPRPFMRPGLYAALHNGLAKMFYKFLGA